MEAIKETLECVDSETLEQFLRSNGVTLMSPEADHSLEIKNSFFDFSKINEYRKTKTIEITTAKSIRFSRCIFVGSIRFKNCTFEVISFKNCQFIKPDFGVAPSSLESLSFSSISTKWLTIERSFFDCPIDIYQGNIEEVKFNYVTCPRLWLQSMWNQLSTLSIYRFLGGKISLPSGTPFKKLWIDDLILRQVEGNINGLIPNIVKFD